MDTAQFVLVKPGATINIYQKIKEVSSGAKGVKVEKERIQVFTGIVIARHKGSLPEATFIVRKISHGIGVEKIFPLHSPLITKIEVVKQAKVRKAKLYYLRDYKKKLREVRVMAKK
jgi:large subunit ribosomal protein L19